MRVLSRIAGIHILTAALLTWILLALGWSDLFDLPGFESSKSPPYGVATDPGEAVPKAAMPRTAEVQRVVEPPPASKSAETKTAERSPPQMAPGPMLPAPVVPRPAEKPVAMPAPQATPAEPPVVRVSPPPAPIEKAPAPKAAEPVKQAAPPAVAPTPTPVPVPAPPARIAEPAPLPPPPKVVEPVRPPSPPPPKVAEPVRTPPPPRAVEPPPVTRAPAVAASSPPTLGTRWAATRRIAGFGADQLLDQLDDPRRAPDDLPCIVFDRVKFRAGTARPLAGVPRELDLIATSLAAVPTGVVQIGSRIGTTRMTAPNMRLAAARARFVRDGLVQRGIPAARVAVDSEAAYHAMVGDDIARMGRRAPSIGVCVLGATV